MDIDKKMEIKKSPIDSKKEKIRTFAANFSLGKGEG